MTYAHTEERDGFTITLECLPEYDAPDWDFDNEKEGQELLDKINCGILLWFCAKVTAHKNGIELASDYLGGCCYYNVADFIKNSGYYDDMVETVIHEAKQAINELCK